MKIKYYYGHSFCVEQKDDSLLGKMEVVFQHGNIRDRKTKVIRARVTCKPDSSWDYHRGVRLLGNKLLRQAARWTLKQHQKQSTILLNTLAELAVSYHNLYSHIKKP